MKLRRGFVSNSSSSSFVCDLTGEAFEVYDGDGGLGEYDAAQCENGHVFFFRGFPKVAEYVEKYDYEEHDYEECSIPAAICPICQKDEKAMKMVSNRIAAIVLNTGVTIQQIETAVQEKQQ